MLSLVDPYMETNLSPSAVPTTLGEGRYRLIRPIGEGGMATVYVGEDRQLRRPRAIKVLHPHYARKKALRTRFEAEARAMAQVEHPHVVRVFDVGLDGRTPYLVMELVERASLDELVADGPMGPLEALDAMLQVCEGVQAAHRAGIVHRDIKPQNILVTADGRCKITDFGIAQVGHETRLTKTGSTMGTLGFMAPEQRYDAKSADVRADVFSLGATLWRLLSPAELTELFLADEQPRLMEGLHEAVASIVLRCVAYAPDDRYPDVAALRAELEAVAAQLAGLDPADLQAAQPHPADDAVTWVDEATLSPQGAERVRAVPWSPPEPTEPTVAEDGLPAWVDRESLTPAARRSLAAPAVTRAPPLPTPPSAPARDDEVAAGREVAEQLKEVARTVVRAVMAVFQGPLRTITLASTLVMALGSLVVGVATFQVRRAELAATTARAALYTTIDREVRIIDDLEAAAGTNAAYLEGLRSEVVSQPEPHRQRAALTYIAAVDEAARTLDHAGLRHKAEMVRVRQERLHEAQQAYERGMLAWEQAADSTHGRLALSLGAARAP